MTTPVWMRARVDWARRRGHPDYLWPDVAIVRWRTALRGIEEAVRAVLADRDRRRDACIAPDLAVADPEVSALGVAAFTSGLGPLLGLWVEKGTLATTTQAATLLCDHLRHGRARAARMREILLDVTTALGDSGIAPVVLKGLHTGAAYFPEPGTRPSADIDLAVRPAEHGAAEAVLARLGWRCTYRRKRPSVSEWCPPWPEAVQSLDLTHTWNPVAIDLHAGIDRDFLGVRRLGFGESPWERAAPLDGVPGGFGLGQPDLFLLLAAHASEELHRLQLLRLVELVLVARSDLRSDTDWQIVRKRARELEAGRFLLPAVELAERLVPGSMDSAWLDELRAGAPARMRTVLADLQPANAQRLDGLSLRDRFLFARGAVEVTRRLAYLVWPARSRRVGVVYAERLWRVLRGRVSVWSSDD